MSAARLARVAGLAALAALVACTGPDAPPKTPGPSPSVGQRPDGSPTGTPSPSPAPTLVPLPSVPAGFPTAVVTPAPANMLPRVALVPDGATVNGTWTARTSAGVAIVVSWTIPGGDPFRAPGGVAEWRRTDDASAWLAVYVESYEADAGVLGVRAEIADVTGDGSEDAVVSEGTGGSGACARWHVIDLVAASLVWQRELCDADVQVETDPVGLRLVQAVFLPGDSHCCPSRMRATVFSYRGDGRWTAVSRRTTTT